MPAPIKPGQLKNQVYLRFPDPQDDTKVVQLALVDTGLAAPDTIPIYALGVGGIGDSNLNVIIVRKTIGPITFTGTGIDDMFTSGKFTGAVNIDFLVGIDSLGAPDTFQWSIDGGVTWVAQLVPITGSPQLLMEGVYIQFLATTGHSGDEWEFTAFAADPVMLEKESEVIASFSIAPLGDGDSRIVDMSDIKEAVLTIMGDFDGATTLGVKVEIFTSPDGVTWDTQPWASTGLEPAVVPGSTEQKSSNLDTLPKFIYVKVTDLEKGFANCYITLTKIKE